MKNFLILASILLLSSCKFYEDLPTVKQVNLDKYQGIWFEQAHLPTRFQEGCSCTTAEYVIEDKYVRVINTCVLKEEDNKVNVSEGKAFVKDKETNAKLAVQFFWPFKGKYWIIDLAEDYSYAMVGHPNREYLWILSRDQNLNLEQFKMLKAKAENLGFDTSKLLITEQDCK